ERPGPVHQKYGHRVGATQYPGQLFMPWLYRDRTDRATLERPAAAALDPRAHAAQPARPARRTGGAGDLPCLGRLIFYHRPDDLCGWWVHCREPLVDATVL